MKYTRIEDSNTKISQIGLGIWQFGTKSWGFDSDFNKKDAINIIHKAIDMEVNLIDTAEIYGGGESERIIGEAIKDYNREDLVLSTKFFPKAIRPSAVERALKKSLKRLQTDYIDVYLIHWPNPLLSIGRTLNNMEKMVDEGLIRYIGVSNFNKKRLRNAQKKMKNKKIYFDQVNYSIAKSDIEKELLPYATNEKILIIAYSPLAQGWLTGKYSADKTIPKGIRRTNRLFRKKNLQRGTQLLNTIKEISESHNASIAQIALSWAIRHPSVIAIPGAKSVSQVEANIQSTEIILSNEEIHAIEKALKEFQPKLLL